MKTPNERRTSQPPTGENDPIIIVKTIMAIALDFLPNSGLRSKMNRARRVKFAPRRDSIERPGAIPLVRACLINHDELN